MLATLLLQLVSNSKTITVTEGVLPAVYGTLIASILSLVASYFATVKSSETSVRVANLAALTARELKEKDHKHDFYKSIIERRLTVRFPK